MSKGNWTDLGRSKLESSGISVKLADSLGMREIASAATLHPSFEALPALVIPYHDLSGLPAKAHPRWPDFFRLRYLAKGTSFKDMATDKSQRYAQPPKTGVCAYFPKTENWQKIAGDTTQGITITEGELKSAAATDMGFPTIGLGGVWNFAVKREGAFMLPELEKIDWRQREVYICFDSDYAEKPGICNAMNYLAEELYERGAIPRVLLLPDVVEDGKTGLDDYFLVHDGDHFEGLLEQSEPIGLGRTLWQLNREVLYAEDPGLIVVEATGQKMSASQFKEHSRWSTASHPIKSINKNGDIMVAKEPAAPHWLKWPLRRSVRKVTYEPGEPRITSGNEFNQWPGWAVEPKPGDVKPFLDLLAFVFDGADKGALEWFLDWCAYPLQYPGTKMFSSVVVYGIVQGTGKSLIGYTLGEIYGENFREITDDDMELTYWAENKQFIMGDEISGNDNRQYANALKRLITQRKVTINIKFVPQYTVPDCINYYFTSQHADAFFVEDTDRRYFINEVIAEQPLPFKFYQDYKRWLWKEGGAAHLFAYLLNRKFVKNPGSGEVFDPAGPAFRTQAKERMTRSGKGDLSSWVDDLKQMPEQMLTIGQMQHTRDLFTSKELLDMFRNEYPENIKVSVGGMGKALSAAGFPQVDGGQPLKGPDGKQHRYFAVRNKATWRKADRKVCERNLTMQPMRKGSK